MQEKYIEEYRDIYPEPERAELVGFSEEVFTAPRGYSDRLDHFRNFFTALRTDGIVVEDGPYGFRAAAPALLTNVSYESKKIINWDPQDMTIIPDSAANSEE